MSVGNVTATGTVGGNVIEIEVEIRIPLGKR